MGSRRPTRTALAVLTAGIVGLTGIGVAVGVESSAGAAPSVRQRAAEAKARIPLDAAVAARARIEAEEALQKAHEAKVATDLAAAVAEYYRPKTGVDWDGIAQCETGGNWAMRGSNYSGGLGFYNGTWTSFGGRQFAANAGQASREQQIVVAERVYAAYGLSGWGCRAYG